MITRRKRNARMKKLAWFVLLPVCLMLGTVRLGAQEEEHSLLAGMNEPGCRQWVDSVMAGMNLREKVGQSLMVASPKQVDKEAKKWLREQVRKSKIGGLLFAGEELETQIALTNLAQKTSQVPLLIALDGGWGLPAHWKGIPVFPKDAALGCVLDDEWIEAYGREVGRASRILGVQLHLAPAADENANPWNPGANVHPFGEHPGRVDKKVSAYVRGLESEGILMKALADDPDFLLITDDPEKTSAGLMRALELGDLTEAEVEARCRRVLSAKYLLGLRAKPGRLKIAEARKQMDTEDARRLAAVLHKEAVTVLGNHFGMLPLPRAGEGRRIALLSMGEAMADSAFVSSMQEREGVDCYRLPWNAPEEEQDALRKKLDAYDRVLVCIAGVNYVGDADVAFLAGLNLRAPLAYVFFTPYRLLPLLIPALEKANAVVLAHSAGDDLQCHVARLLFAETEAHGRLSMGVGRLFPEGAGCDIVAGMQPADAMPDDYGMKSYVLHGIDALARKGVEAGAYPGCRVLIWKDGMPVYEKGFGRHSDKDTTSVRATDLFDLSALTKTSATLLAIMKLYDEGRLKLDDKASAFLPYLRKTDKRNITLRQLLMHESGLPPYMRFYLEAIDPHSVHGPYAQSWKDQWHQTRVSEHSYYCSDFRFKRGLMAEKETSTHTLHVAEGMWMNKNFVNTILQSILRCQLEGRRYIDSDLGFILLQQVVEHVARMPLDAYVSQNFYAPMGLERILFCPLEKFPPSEIMPTASNDFLRRQDLCGYVHDEASACMGGVAGHAGLFATASDLASLYQMLLDGGVWKGKRYLSEETCRLFTTEKSRISRRGLGFDKPDVESVKHSPCAPSAPEAVYGHTAFTGTSVWVDPGSRTVYVFLSNRLCPDVWNTKLGDMDIMEDIQELIFDSLKVEEEM